MAPANLFKSRSRITIIIGALIFAAIIIAALFYIDDRSAGITESKVQAGTDDSPAAESNASAMSQEDIEEAQRSAAKAAITGKPVSGTVTERPDYVSEIEWDVFQNVIRNQPESNDMQLTTLVNKLLFFKKKEAWESPGTTAAQRRELAGDLLAMLPFMTEGGHIAADEASRLETECQRELRAAAH